MKKDYLSKLTPEEKARMERIEKMQRRLDFERSRAARARYERLRTTDRGENFGVHSRTWRPLGFGSANHYKHYLTAKGWWHKLSLKENPDIKADVSERYARIAIPALVKQALNGSFQATRMILVDQCKDWGWGAADIETAAAGAGKTIAELFGEAEEPQKAEDGDK